MICTKSKKHISLTIDGVPLGVGVKGCVNCTDSVLSVIFTSKKFKHTCRFLRKFMNTLLTEPVTLKKIWLALRCM